MFHGCMDSYLYEILVIIFGFVSFFWLQDFSSSKLLLFLCAGSVFFVCFFLFFALNLQEGKDNFSAVGSLSFCYLQRGSFRFPPSFPLPGVYSWAG